MNITSITAHFERLQTLPGHCNVATGFTMTAEVPAEGDPFEIQLCLRSEVEDAVNKWIDTKLEEAGQPAKFSTDPRYTLIYWKQANRTYVIPNGTKLEQMPGIWITYPSDTDTIYAGHRLPALREMVDELGLPGSEFDSADALREWAWTYLDLPITWSIVRIHGSVDGENWYFLGRAILPGDVYSALRVDDSLQTELHRSVGAVGLYDDVLKTAEDMSQTPTPIFRTLDEVGNWTPTRLLAVTAQESLDDPF